MLAARDRLSLGARQEFFRSLAVLFGASINLAEAILILEKTERDPGRSQVYSQAYKGLASGYPLSKSLAKASKSFSPQTLALVVMGENSGSLVQALNAVVERLDAEMEARKKFQAATTYPLILTTIALFLVIGMIVFFLPQMADFAKNLNTELSLPLVIVMGLADFVLSPYALFLATQAVILPILIYRRLARSKRFRQKRDELILGVPVLGRFLRVLLAFQFAAGMESLVKCGMPLLKSLRLLSAALPNEYAKLQMDGVCRDLENEGITVAESLATRALFPKSFHNLLACGEEAGQLEQVLKVLSNYYREEVEEMAERTAALIEPIVLMGLGVLVGGTTLLFFLPMVQVISTL